MSTHFFVRREHKWMTVDVNLSIERYTQTLERNFNHKKGHAIDVLLALTSTQVAADLQVIADYE